ncbi:MAG: hypothetical protein ACREQJ_09935 [Candidatus Binatia bacterium]
MVLDEEASDADIPKAVDVVVFVTSPDTYTSTRMQDLFVCVYDRVSAQAKYALGVGGADLEKFPELRHLPRISPGDLASVVWAASAGHARARGKRPEVTRTYRRSRPPRRPT